MNSFTASPHPSGKIQLHFIERLTMFNSANRPPRPKLTAAIMGYALIDVFGLLCVSIGASWFATGNGAIFKDFPSSTAEAVVCTAGGVVVMIWAVTRILREIGKQSAEMHAKYNAYIAAQHPDKLKSLDEFKRLP